DQETLAEEEEAVRDVEILKRGKAKLKIDKVRMLDHSEWQQDSDSDDDAEEEYSLKKDEYGKPFYGPHHPPYLDSEDAMDRSLAEQDYLDPFNNVCIWKKVVSFLGSLPVSLKNIDWKPNYSGRNSKESEDRKWHVNVKIVDPFCNAYERGVWKSVRYGISKDWIRRTGDFLEIRHIKLYSFVVFDFPVKSCPTLPILPYLDVDEECAFPSANILDYTSTLPNYFPATPGNISSDFSENPKNDEIPPVFSPFYNNPYLKDMQAFNAKEPPIPPPDHITPLAILTPSPVLPSSLLFDPLYFFVPEELLPPKK
ncbi:hypothetical protein Tco_0807637, partial [Tanacetum coccineum]